jgi:hypothetical protein
VLDRLLSADGDTNGDDWVEDEDDRSAWHPMRLF